MDARCGIGFSEFDRMALVLSKMSITIRNQLSELKNKNEELTIESNLENLAECHLRATEENLSNVVFWPISLAEKFLSDGNTIHFASISHDAKLTTPHFISLVENSLSPKGVLNVKLSESLDPASADIRELVLKQDLQNTTANIKALRSTILSDKDSVYWSKLIHAEYFYSIDGCREAWFNEENNQQFLSALTHLIDQEKWSLSKVLNHNGKAVSIDLAQKNLQKIAKEKLSNKIEMIVGDSEEMPFKDNTFDAITVSFGVRNFANLAKGITEIARVLKPTGVLVILETSNPTKFPFKQGYKLYTNLVLPVIGKLFSKDKVAYSYLSESANSFPFGEAFNNILQKNGFTHTEDTPVTFGVATIYTASK